MGQLFLLILLMEQMYTMVRTGDPCQPCVYTEFDFTKVTKIIMFCNPGAGATWSKTRVYRYMEN